MTSSTSLLYCNENETRARSVGFFMSANQRAKCALHSISLNIDQNRTKQSDWLVHCRLPITAPNADLPISFNVKETRTKPSGYGLYSLTAVFPTSNSKELKKTKKK